MLNSPVHNPNKNNSQKNFHAFGRTEYSTSRVKGSLPGSKGCKNQLVILKVIHEDCKRRSRNLDIAWIDYQKTFGCVPHSWIEKSIELIRVNCKIFILCKLSMETWNTRLHINTMQEVIQSQLIQIRRGIFHGDSLSLLLFFTELFPLTHELN